MNKNRILIVEDEFLIATDIQMSLIKMGYDVIGVTAYGEDAIEQARIEKPDLILMDVNLKGKIDGIEAARIIIEKYGTAIIFITSHTDSSTFRKAISISSANYLNKPFNEKELKIIIGITLFEKSA